MLRCDIDDLFIPPTTPRKEVRMPVQVGTAHRIIKLSRKILGPHQGKVFEAEILDVGSSSKIELYCFRIQGRLASPQLKDEQLLFTHPIIEEVLKQLNKTRMFHWVDLWLDGDNLNLQIKAGEGSDEKVYQAPIGDAEDLSNKPLKLIRLEDKTDEIMCIDEWVCHGGKLPFLMRKFVPLEHGTFTLIVQRSLESEQEIYTFENIGELMESSFLEAVVEKDEIFANSIELLLRAKIAHPKAILKLLPHYFPVHDKLYQQMVKSRVELFSN